MKNKLLHKAFSVITSISLLVNPLLAPFSVLAQAAVVWPVEWISPGCNTDPSDESPSQLDLIGDVSNSAAYYSIDDNYLYLKERIEGDPRGSSNSMFTQHNWVVVVEQTGDDYYDYLFTLNGKDEKVQIWENTTQAEVIDWSPIFNDPAETEIWNGPVDIYSRIDQDGAYWFVSWAIPRSTDSFTLNSDPTLYFSTSANANNYNKDHLDCYEEPELNSITVVKDEVPNDGTEFTFSISGPDFYTNTFGLIDDGGDGSETITLSDLVAGEYTITETNSAFPYTTSISCTNLASDTDNDITFELGVDNPVTCTFTNTLIPSTITVHKETIPSDGGQTSFGVTLYNAFGAIGMEQPLTTSSSVVYTVEPGITYHVNETSAPGGWAKDDSDCQSLEVGRGESEECTITNTKLGSIQGRKYYDVNANGTFDQEEKDKEDDPNRLDDWEMSLYTNLDENPIESLFTGHTGNKGQYKFENLPLGTYYICETLQSGWVQTEPSSGPEKIGTKCHTVSLEIGEDKGGVQFGNYKLGSIFGHKYEDTDGDLSTNEYLQNPIQGWEISLWQDVIQIGESVFTDEYGYYSFIELLLGIYQVKEEEKTDWTNLNTTSVQIEVGTSGEGLGPIDFVNFENGFISGHKWNDIDGDGYWDEGEQTLVGWKMWLDGPEGEDIYKTTDENGYYKFSDLGPGTYRVYEELLGDWKQTAPEGNEYIVEMTSNGNYDGRDFGNFRFASISGHKWNDIDGNGNWEEEPSLEEWTFELQKLNGEIWNTVATDVTDLSGNWSFGGMEYGKYRVHEILQPNWTPTTYTSGYYPSVAGMFFTSGQNIINVNFGNFKEGYISGHKWNDIDGDGYWDEGEPALEGWKIWLDRPEGGDIFRTTEANGYYYFGDLGPGQYRIHEELQAGWNQTAPASGEYVVDMISGAQDLNNPNYDFGNRGALSIHACKYEDSNGAVTGGEFTPVQGWEFILNEELTQNTGDGHCTIFSNLVPDTYVVSELVSPGWYISDDSGGSRTVVLTDSNQTVNFFNTKYASIGDFIWKDIDADGVQDAGEPGISGVSADLYKDSIYLGSAVTDSNGEYIFEGLEAGDYWVDVDNTTLPAGYINTTPDPVGPITLNSGDIYMLADVGYIPPAKEVRIEKSNDKSSGASAEEEVIYTLVVTNTGDVTIGKIEVIDVLPGGFDYVTGSTSIIGATTVEPSVLGGKLTWSIDAVLVPEDSVTITYQAAISSDIGQGIYTNLATCKAVVGGIPTVNGDETYSLTLVYEPETIWCNIADSFVPIGADFTYSDGLRGEVLGAATELPATGNDTRVLLMLYAMLALGASLKVVSYNMAEKKERKNV